MCGVIDFSLGGERCFLVITDEEVTSLMPLVKYFVFKTIGHLDDDLIQEGFDGVLKARESFDPSKGRTWPTWAGYKAEKAIIDYLRTKNRTRAKQKFTNCSFEDLENILTPLFSFENDTIKSLDKDQLRKDILEIVNAQTIDRRIRLYLISLGFSKSDVAKLTNVDPATISYDMRQMRKHEGLRDILNRR